MAYEGGAIQITVDASQAQAGLKALQSSIRDTSSALKDLGSASGSSGGFQTLLGQMNQLSAGFDKLKAQAGSINNVQASIGRMSANPIKSVATELGLLATVAKDAESAFGLLETALGIAALEKLGAGIQKAGTALLSTKFSLDAVATSSREAGDQLRFVEEIANRTGSSLSDSIETYKQLAGSMRPLGKSVEEIQHVFEGFTTAMSVMHVPINQQKISMRELAESYGQGAIHATVALRSLGSHISGMSALLQQASGLSGEKMHAAFRNGGLDLSVWDKLSTILIERYKTQLPEALNHSVAAVALLGNEWTKVQQIAFENGFDRGLTALAKAAQESGSGIENLGKAIGGAFEGLFTFSAKALTVLREFKEPLKDLALASISIRGVSLGMSVLAMAGAAATSPMTLLSVALALVIGNWDSIKESFSHAGEVFASFADSINVATNGFINLRKAALGAVEVVALAKGLWSGKSLDDSKQLAYQAGLDFQAGKSSGTNFFDGFKSEAKRYFGEIRSIFSELLPNDSASKISDAWKKIDEQTKPHSEAGAGQYESNRKRYDEINADRSLSSELEKLLLKLNPTTAALKTYREELEKIAQMKGKTFDGKEITDGQLAAMRDSAKQDALKSFAPQTERIQQLMDAVKIERDARAAVGDERDALESERAVLTWKNEMLRKNVTVTDEEVNAVRELIKAQKSFNDESKNGFAQWVKGVKDGTESLNDNLKSSLDSISEGISKIVTEGKGKLKSLGAAIRDELKSVLKGIAKNFINAGIKGLMAEGIKGLGLDKLFGSDNAAALKKALGLGQGALDSASKKLDDAMKQTAEMTVTAGVVNINGASINGASGLNAFSPSGVNPNGAGGVLPTSSAPVFANSNVAPSLGSIPSNSAQLFGGLSSSSAAPLGALAPLATAINPGNAAGIDANSVSAFGRLIDLQKSAVSPLAKAGLTAPTGALPSFGGLDAATAKVLGTVDPELQKLAMRAREISGIDFKMNPLQGMRTAEMQAKLYAQGRTAPGNIVTYKDGINKLSEHQSGKAADFSLLDKNGKYIANGGDPAYRKFNDGMQQAAKERGDVVGWGGNWQKFKDNDHWQLEGKGSGSSADLTHQMSDSSRKVADDFKTKMDSAIKQPTDRLKTTLNQDFTSVLGQGGKGARDLTKLGDSITKVGQDAQGAESGLGGLIWKLSSLGGGLGGGGAGDAASLTAGAFLEGGLSTSPVSSGTMPASFWAGAPHFSEGGVTSGGIPIIAHENEAIVPLSRGRSIPVEMKGGDHGGASVIHQHRQTVNIATKDADSFRRNVKQITGDLHRESVRNWARNG